MRLLVLMLAAACVCTAQFAQAEGSDEFFEGVKSYRARQYDDAVAWFRKAAEQGDAEAQFLLGRMYYDGSSVAVDYIAAHMWFDIAAGSGVRVAPRYRDGLAERMKAEDVEAAQRRAADWRAEHPAAAKAPQ